MSLALALALLLADASTGQTPGQSYELRAGTLSYTLVHKLHEVTGSSQKLEGRALFLPDGTGRVQVRATVASFESGNANRDEHMREATHEVAHPNASVKGTLQGLALPLTAKTGVSLHATVELNGVKQAVEIPLVLEPVAGGGVHGTFSFPVSLDAFKVERPELFFVKVDDKVVIHGDLTFEAPK